MIRIAKFHKKMGLISTVATLTIALAACTLENADNVKNEGNAPQESIAALAAELRSDEQVELPTPSFNASTLEDLEVKWKVIAPDDEHNPCPCEYGSTPITGNLTVAPAPLLGNHATVVYEEIEFGSYGEAKLYLVARDRYVGDTNKDENYEGFTYEAWLVALGDKLNSEGTLNATTVMVKGQSSIRDVYEKGKQLSKYAVLSDGNGHYILHSLPNIKDGVALVSVDFRNQIAILENRSKRDIDLRGWGLEGTNKREVYVFSEGTVLKAGDKLTVIAGLTEGMTPSPGVIVWENNRFPWRYDGDQAVLRNADEEVVSHIEGPNLTPPVIMGRYKNMPITATITSNRGVTAAMAAFKEAAGTPIGTLQINEAKQAEASNGRTIWMLMLRSEGQNEGAFADVRIDPNNGELLMASGLGGATVLAPAYDDAGPLEKLANDRLQLLLGDAHAEYKMIDFVNENGYTKMTLEQKGKDIYQLVYSDAEGFTSIARPWLLGLQ